MCSCFVLVLGEGNSMKSVENLHVFKLAHQLGAQDLFGDQDVSKRGNFCLIDQMKRAAASVGMNLMEGAMRLGSEEYRQFVGIGEARLGKSRQRFEIYSNETYQELRSGYDRRPTDSHFDVL